VLDRATNGVIVAFETDGLDADGSNIWSVSVVGRASHVGPVALSSLSTVDLPKWSMSLADQVIRVHPELVSGRRWETGPGKRNAREPARHSYGTTDG
jgi:hypothetical protein